MLFKALVQAPIGIFDSGVGGLSVLRAIRNELPAEKTIYLADQAHVPYGSRRLEEVRSFATEITRFLLEKGSKIIVLACNTASAAALHYLRQQYPNVAFVGMEPAIKPAVENTISKVVGVLATPATFQGALYASVVERFAEGVTILQNTCQGLVNQIEAGDLDDEETRTILEHAIHPMLASGIDTVVLGCTHYPFVIPLIQQITGPGVRVIDPAPAIARQVRRVLTEQNIQSRPEDVSSTVGITTANRYLTTGDPGSFQNQVFRLIGEKTPVEQVVWVDGALKDYVTSNTPVVSPHDKDN